MLVYIKQESKIKKLTQGPKQRFTLSFGPRVQDATRLEPWWPSLRVVVGGGCSKVIYIVNKTNFKETEDKISLGEFEGFICSISNYPLS